MNKAVKLFLISLLIFQYGYSQQSDTPLVKFGVIKATKNDRDITKIALRNGMMFSFVEKANTMFLIVSELQNDKHFEGAVRDIHIPHVYKKPEYKRNAYIANFNWGYSDAKGIVWPFKRASAIITDDNEDAPHFFLRIEWEQGTVTQYDCRRIGTESPRFMEWIKGNIDTSSKSTDTGIK